MLDPLEGDPELKKLTERVEKVEAQAQENAEEIRKIAAAAGIQDLDWYRKRRAYNS